MSMNTNDCSKLNIRRIPKHIWLLLLIVCIGVFLRTYHFHDWLEFKGDQARDASLVQDVVAGNAEWPLTGPFMSNSAANKDETFHIGPLYYYFQIVSAQVFGNIPESLAYPDVLFSILSLPLFYLFFRKYLDQKLSLGVTFLYVVSFFFVMHSRFAWNSNLIPCFTLLFLLSLFEFESGGIAVGWLWAVLLGIALGVGVQLHAITMIIFSAVTVLSIGRSIFRKQSIPWKKWAVVFAVALLLNTGQIIGETQTGFSNAKIFLGYFTNTHHDTSASNQPWSDAHASLVNDIDCHLEANLYLFTSLGQDHCVYSFDVLLSGTRRNAMKILFETPLFFGALFSIFGFAMLVIRCASEKDERKRIWLRMIAWYIAVSFLIMFPVVKGSLELRYFNFAFFLPFLFLGLLAEHVMSQKNTWLLYTVLLAFPAIAMINILSLSSVYDELVQKGRIYSRSVVLDEIEPIATYVVAHADGHTTISLSGNSKILDYAFHPLVYLVAQSGKELIRVGASKVDDVARSGQKVFFVSTTPPDPADAPEYGAVGEKIYVYEVRTNQ